MKKIYFVFSGFSIVIFLSLISPIVTQAFPEQEDLPERASIDEQNFSRERLEALIRRAQETLYTLDARTLPDLEKREVEKNIQNAQEALTQNASRQSIRYIFQAYTKLKVLRARAKKPLTKMDLKKMQERSPQWIGLGRLAFSFALLSLWSSVVCI